MKKIAFSLLIAAASLSISGAYANTPEPESNSNPNDCGQYGVSYRVITSYDQNTGARNETVEVSRANSDVDFQATVTRERQDNSTYNTQIDSRNKSTYESTYDYDNMDSSYESNSGNGDRVTNVDMKCYKEQ